MLPQLNTIAVKTVAVVAVIGGVWWANQHYVVNPAVARNEADWQKKWAARDASDSAAALKQRQQNREKELSLQAAADAEQHKADVARSDLARRLAASRAASERLQQGIANAISALDKGSTVAGVTSGGATGTRSGLLLAELYRSINQRATDLAGEADRARAAGLTCERLYNNARISGADSEEKAR